MALGPSKASRSGAMSVSARGLMRGAVSPSGSAPRSIIRVPINDNASFLFTVHYSMTIATPQMIDSALFTVLGDAGDFDMVRPAFTFEHRGTSGVNALWIQSARPPLALPRPNRAVRSATLRHALWIGALGGMAPDLDVFDGQSDIDPLLALEFIVSSLTRCFLFLWAR